MDFIPKALNLMVTELQKKPDFNWERRSMTVKGENSTTEVLFEEAFGAGLGDEPLTLASTLKQGFGNSYGKFPVAYGNVVILDCNYIFDTLIVNANNLIDKNYAQGKLKFQQWVEAKAAIGLIKNGLDKHNITMCDYTIELDGILNDQTEYYMQSTSAMETAILAKGADIVDATTRASNYTMSAPLMTSFEKLGMQQAYLNSSFMTVICFLGILVACLLYSLILADVD
jgi:hypothetical protein